MSPPHADLRKVNMEILKSIIIDSQEILGICCCCLNESSLPNMRHLQYEKVGVFFVGGEVCFCVCVISL